MFGFIGTSSWFHEDPIFESAVGNRKGGVDRTHEGHSTGILEARHHRLHFGPYDAGASPASKEEDQEGPLH